MKLKLLALTVSFLFLASAKPALAFDLPDLIRSLPVASQMFNWGEDFVIGQLNNTVSRSLTGCTYDEITGPDVENKIAACVNKSGFPQGNNSTISTNTVPASLLGIVATLSLEAPKAVDAYPVNLAVYVNDIKHDSLILPQEAYASGISEIILGANILGLWKSLRNIAYVFFVLMLVIFGFMVMFRYKIDPQTVITVQAALPKVVINLLLITFSFPLGVLALDLMAMLTIWGTQLVSSAVGTSIGGLTSTTMVTGLIGSVAKLLVMIPGGGAIVVVLIFVVVLVIVLLTLIAWTITILTRLLRIMLMTAFAPLQFAFATIPGNEHLITDWFKSLIGNVLAVPAVAVIGLLGLYFIIFSGPIAASGSGNGVIQVVLSFFGSTLNMIIGLWLLWNARNAPKWIEGGMGIGGGWSPGQAPKPDGKK